MVIAYGIKVWDHNLGATVIAPTKATTERIAMMRGEIVPGTQEEVNITEIDEQGRLSPNRPLGAVTPKGPRDESRLANVIGAAVGWAIQDAIEHEGIVVLIDA